MSNRVRDFGFSPTKNFRDIKEHLKFYLDADFDEKEYYQHGTVFELVQLP